MRPTVTVESDTIGDVVVLLELVSSLCEDDHRRFDPLLVSYTGGAMRADELAVMCRGILRQIKDLPR